MATKKKETKSETRTSHKSLAHLKVAVLESKNGKTKEEK